MATLKTLLKQAEAAPPESRIEFRDAIAAHGAEAIAAVTPWLADPRLGAFAARVITAAGRQGDGPAALAAFTVGLETAGSPAVRRDVEAGLAEFAPPRRRRPLAGHTAYEILDDGADLRGQPAARYRIATHKERGCFDVPQAVMDLLAIPPGGWVDLDITLSSTGALVFSGELPITSGMQIQPNQDDMEGRELRSLAPYETIDVTVARSTVPERPAIEASA